MHCKIYICNKKNYIIIYNILGKEGEIIGKRIGYR